MSKRFRCLVIVGVVFACVCIVAVAIGVYLVQQEREAVIEAYGEDIAEMCDPPAGGVASLDNLPNTGTPLKALILEQDDTLKHNWHDDLDNDLKADDKDELDVVICVAGQSTNTVENCPYGDIDDPNSEDTLFTVNRVQKSVTITLLNAETGNRIVELSASGSQPGECPDEYRAQEGSTNQIAGGDVSFNDFMIVVEPFLRGESQ